MKTGNLATRPPGARGQKQSGSGSFPSLKEECSKEAKLYKGTKFIIRDTAQSMGEHTEKQFVEVRN